MRTTKKEVCEKIQAYIKECCDDGLTLPDVLERFKREKLCHYELKYHGSYQAVSINWLWGLPSAFNVDHATHTIIELMESWGLKQPENKTDHESCQLFMYLVFREFCKLLKKEHKIDFMKEVSK